MQHSQPLPEVPIQIPMAQNLSIIQWLLFYITKFWHGLLHNDTQTGHQKDASTSFRKRECSFCILDPFLLKSLTSFIRQTRSQLSHFISKLSETTQVSFITIDPLMTPESINSSSGFSQVLQIHKISQPQTLQFSVQTNSLSLHS